MLIEKIKAIPKEGEINVIIEIPMNDNKPIKYEFDKESGGIFVDRFMQSPMYYPCNYGFIPHTLANDGDPVDVLVISHYALIAGCVIRTRPIGVLMMQDESGMDEKIIAVPTSKLDITFDTIKDLNDLKNFKPLLQERIVHFFEHYKDLEKVACFTLISRIFGLIRELFIASLFGATNIADSVNVAFKLPNLFRRIFGEGALVSSFIPIFNEKILESKDSATSFIEGAISILSYADRIYQFPLSLIGVTLGTILLPELSKIYKLNDLKQAVKIQNEAIKIGLLLSLPAAFGIIALADPIIHIIYERGEFSLEDRVKTAEAISAFAIGLPAFILIKILTPIFYANQDTKTPLKITIYSLIINTLLNIILMIKFSHVGIALGSSIAAWYNAFLLYKYTKKHVIFSCIFIPMKKEPNYQDLLKTLVLFTMIIDHCVDYGSLVLAIMALGYIAKHDSDNLNLAE
ncbi:unnamed protein product [Oppiella nova]|uniref:inorganic diphosphatase n=1 Tax=Oppiella nova TaxID=334625 RepID=A0A7R9QSK3_9ACAR|nr:unnamed protein product [Oppiella nova]CAG2172373.1 unnamed protein product [Oppiella nova]